MRAVVQRVQKGQVMVAGESIGAISQGLVILLGFQPLDDEKSTDYMLEKVFHLRIFEDTEGKMNQSLVDIQGELLIIPNFTLYGDCRKGRRPSFSKSASPSQAEEMFNEFIKRAHEKGKEFDILIQQGKFQADMQVEIVNDGPVTLIIDSEKMI